MQSQNQVSDLLHPNKEQIKQHLNVLFGDLAHFDDGKIEIAWSAANTKAIPSAKYFDVSEIKDAADFAYEKNKQEGVNLYVGAALRKPNSPPFGRSSSDDYYAASCVWADIDDGEQADKVKDLYQDLVPSIVVVTGRLPHKRCHLWWKLSEPCEDSARIKSILAGLKEALGGDAAVVDPVRIMRLAGTVAWPKKEGRAAELTSCIVPRNATIVTSIEHIESVFPPISMSATTEAGYAIENDGKPRDIITGNLEIIKLLEKTKEPGQWHTNMRDAVAAMVGKGWTNEQIKLGTADYADDGVVDRDVEVLIRTARDKWQMPDTGIYQQSKGIIQPAPLAFPDKVPATVRELPLMFMGDMVPSLDTHDFVEDFLREGEFSIIYGESNCGKTFFTLDLAMHVALGKTWRGKEVDGGGVIYAALEGGQGTVNRLCAFNQTYGIKDDVPLAVIPSNINFLDVVTDMPAFLRAIDRGQQQMGGIKMIVIDTLSRALSGGDENSSTDMGRLVIHADVIRKETGAHVCFVHHSGKDVAKGSRGHSSLRAAVDTEVEISRKDKESNSLVRTVKQREMEMIEDMAFALERVVLGKNRRGKEVSSCVVMPAEVEHDHTERKVMSASQQFLFDCVTGAAIRAGTVRTIDGREVMSINYEQLFEEMLRRGDPDVNHNSELGVVTQVKRRIRTDRNALRKMGKLGANNNYLWIMEE